MFRVHLHNQRNEHNVLMDEKTIESLKEFNENVFNLLDSYKCSSGTSKNSCINSESSLEELVIISFFLSLQVSFLCLISKFIFAKTSYQNFQKSKLVIFISFQKLHVVVQKEMLNTDLIKFKAMTENLDNILKILRTFNTDSSFSPEVLNYSDFQARVKRAQVTFFGTEQKRNSSSCCG